MALTARSPVEVNQPRKKYSEEPSSYNAARESIVTASRPAGLVFITPFIKFWRRAFVLLMIIEAKIVIDDSD